MADHSAGDHADFSEPYRMPPLTGDKAGGEAGGGAGGVIALAPAKLNLTLHIGPLRDDGFHDLFSMAVKTDLCDELRVSPRSDSEITLNCLPQPPCPTEQNLVYRAAILLARRGGISTGADIELVKNIPDGAGLGGGSADAAVTLAALNRIWQCGLNARELASLGAELGSDVPLTFAPAACIMSGRGEKIAAAELSDFCALLLTPAIHCPTGEVYAAFDRANSSTQLNTDASSIAKKICNSKSPATDWPALIVNDLAEPAMVTRPDLRDIRDTFTRATGLPVHITGSGSGLYAICSDTEQAGNILNNLEPKLSSMTRIIRKSDW